MNKKFALIIFALFAFALAACAQAKAPQAAVEEVSVAEAPVVATVIVERTQPPAEGAREAGGGSTNAEYSPLSLPVNTGRMVIKDAIMDLLVENTDRALDNITELAATEGGYILSARSWYEDDYKYASIKMGVPSATFEHTLTLLRALGIKVLNETASGQDVSAEYNDLQSRLNNLEATAARVRAFLDEAKTVEESLKINATLSDLEGQIEQVKGQMKFYEGRAAYSTIEVNLSPFVPTPTPTLTPTPTPTPTLKAWTPGQTFQDASRAGTKLWRGVLDALIWMLLILWPLMLLAAIIILIVWYNRRKHPKPPKTPKPQAPPPPPARSSPPPAG